MKPDLVVRPAAQGQGQVGAVAERVAQSPQPKPAFIVGQIRHEHGDQAFAVNENIRPLEMTLGLAAALLAERKQPAET